MPICVTGMHRSGTSLVAQLLSVCGVDFGPEDEFFPANEFNADGYWENTRLLELDDAVLETLGGGWDSPPAPPADWALDERLGPVRASAVQALEELAFSEPWAWKDPRVSLTLPFWLDLLPDLKVVVCVRHPLEVVRSLHRRGATSAQLGLSLWQAYNERLLESAGRERRVVTHYAAYLADARKELKRVAKALGLDVTAKVLAEAASRVRGDLRHHDAHSADDAAIPLPEDVLALYDALCAEAGVEPEPRPKPARKQRRVAAPLSQRLAADAWRAHIAGVREDRDNWRSAAEEAAADSARLRAEAEGLKQELDGLRGRAEQLDESRAGWEQEAGRQTEAHEHWEREASRLSEVVDELTARAGALEGELAQVRQEREAFEVLAAGLEGELSLLRQERETLEAQRAALEARVAVLEAERNELRRVRETLQMEHSELKGRAGALEAERSELRRERAAVRAEQSALQAEHTVLRADHAALQAEHSALQARARALEVERGELAATAEGLRKELQESEDAAGELRSEIRGWRESHAALSGELAVRRQDLISANEERAAYAEDRDRWRDQARLLFEDRDRWQERATLEARHAVEWRETAERLAAERRVGARLRRAVAGAARFLLWLPALLWSWLRRPRPPRAGFWLRLRLAVWRKVFPHARRAWWALPRRLRDFLRPIIFKDARARPAVRAYAPPRIKPMPSPRTAGTGVNREIPRHRRPEEPREAAPGIASVSVVIPTKNGGPLFERAMAEIGRQDGLGEVELVIVDSGSTDGTQDTARRAGATVIEIPQTEFGHGRTRNLAAESASGDVLLMLVQDAVPLTRHVFRSLVAELLEDPRAAAVSARQVPRSDADLYGAFVVSSHDRVTARERARGLTKPAERRTPAERRALAGLDDVCAAIRRAAWEELRFADVEFAEDLDFGLRAVEAGWTILHSASAAVAHSHNRDAAYHLRRAAADRLFVAERLGDEQLSRAASAGPASVAAAAFTLAAELEGAIRRVPVHLEPEATLDSWLQALGRMLDRKPPRMEPTGELALLAEALRGGNGHVELDPPVDELRQEVIALLAWPPLRDFGRAQLAPEAVAVASLVAKLAASAIGRALGDALRTAGDHQRADRLIAGI